MTEFSYQLYSSRSFPPLDSTLKMLAELGYTQVEGWGGLFADPEQLGQLKTSLAGHGLTMPTGHIGFDMVKSEPERVLQIAKSLDMKGIFVPAPPDETYRSGTGDWSAFAAELASAGRPYWDAGLAFGYHNHWWEFAPQDGQMPLDLIMQADDRMALELDVAWAIFGRQDALDWIARYRGRIFAAHVKDLAPDGENADEQGLADVGQGTMNWPELLSALKSAGCRYFVMEHDKPADDRRFASRSIQYARTAA